MIGDLIGLSLRQPNQVVPVEALLGNCDGSRMPVICSEKLTPAVAQKIVEVCPTAALELKEYQGQRCVSLSYGRCTGCGRCIDIGGDVVVPAKQVPWRGIAREDLTRYWSLDSGQEIVGTSPSPAEARGQIHSLLQRALNIRQLDAGSCNGCEAEITALTNPYYDLERFGIHFVASPKHADMLLVTGPVTRNMAEAVKATYEAVPAPKLVVAVGACGCSGGIFRGSYAIVGAVDAVIPVDGYIPGCPPTPAMLVTGILEVLRRRAAK